MQNTNIIEARAQPGWITLTKLLMCQWKEPKPTYNVCNMCNCINKHASCIFLENDSKGKGKIRGTKTSYLNNYIKKKCIVACSIKRLAKTSSGLNKNLKYIYRMASVISLQFGCCQTALPTGGRVLSESFTLERLCARFVTDFVRCLIWHPSHPQQ